MLCYVYRREDSGVDRVKRTSGRRHQVPAVWRLPKKLPPPKLLAFRHRHLALQLSTTTAATMSKAITVAYALDPPSSIDAAAVGQPQSGELSFPIIPAAPTRSTTASYYTAASASLKEAQAKANEVFTAWKDAIGDAEKHKENVGKVGKGQGKAARMMAANKAAEAAFDSNAAEDESEDEDGVDLAEAGACEYTPLYYEERWRGRHSAMATSTLISRVVLEADELTKEIALHPDRHDPVGGSVAGVLERTSAVRESALVAKAAEAWADERARPRHVRPRPITMMPAACRVHAVSSARVLA